MKKETTVREPLISSLWQSYLLIAMRSNFALPEMHGRRSLLCESLGLPFPLECLEEKGVSPYDHLPKLVACAVTRLVRLPRLASPPPRLPLDSKFRAVLSRVYLK